MTEEKESEANRGNNARQRRPRNFEFEISADDAAKQKERRQCRNPESDLLETRRIERYGAALESSLLH